MAREFEDLKPGDQIQCYHFNLIYKELRRLRKMSAAAPIVLRNMASADEAPKLEFYRNSFVVGYANGAITAANSNGWGTGIVTIQSVDDANGVMEDGANIDVRNYARDGANSVGSIANGTRVYVQLDSNKTAWVAAAECP